MRSSLCKTIAAFVLITIGAAAKVTEPQRISAGEIIGKYVITGALGVPIGEEVTIHGHKTRPAGPDSGTEFLVDTINGNKLQPPAEVGIRGIEKWRYDQEATIRGYEIGTIRFLHAEDTNISPREKFTPRQVLLLNFRAIEVLGQANLKLGASRD
jgi:hypothetical protein